MPGRLEGWREFARQIGLFLETCARQGKVEKSMSGWMDVWKGRKEYSGRGEKMGKVNLLS